MRTATIGVGRAHGTAILVGEHTVGHGMPAIAVPLRELPVHARAGFDPVPLAGSAPDPAAPDPAALGPGFGPAAFEVRFACAAGDYPISRPRAAVAASLRGWGSPDDVVHLALRCAIPPALGLGSGAACAAAAVAAVADLYGKPAGSLPGAESMPGGEWFARGSRGGVDARAATATGPMWFQHGAVCALPSRIDAVLLIADTGVRGSARIAVDRARVGLERDPAHARRRLAGAASLTAAAARELAAGRPRELGVLLTDFHTVLEHLGFSTSTLDRMVAIALAAGALGAKLTGGCVLALAENPGSAARISRALRRAGAKQIWTAPTAGWPR
jgi:mevalonate kinase